MASRALLTEHLNRPSHDAQDAQQNVNSHDGQKTGSVGGIWIPATVVMPSVMSVVGEINLMVGKARGKSFLLSVLRRATADARRPLRRRRRLVGVYWRHRGRSVTVGFHENMRQHQWPTALRNKQQPLEVRLDCKIRSAHRCDGQQADYCENDSSCPSTARRRVHDDKSRKNPGCRHESPHDRRKRGAATAPTLALPRRFPLTPYPYTAGLQVVEGAAKT